ncbi:hypothetical protein KE513_00885 [Oscillospiraceae bacterium Marseille-Q3528]|nr:hypothetical protein [Oscillospiraceae bacterium Marseille-Q3528]
MGRRKKKHKGLRAVFTLIVVLLIILAAVLVWGGQLGKTVKKKAAGAVLQQISQQAAESSDGTATGDAAAVLGQVYSNMDEADQEKLQEIIADNADQETLEDVKNYVESGDTDGLIQYAQENFSAEDSEAAMELYEKYKDQLGQ